MGPNQVLGTSLAVLALSSLVACNGLDHTSDCNAEMGNIGPIEDLCLNFQSCCRRICGEIEKNRCEPFNGEIAIECTCSIDAIPPDPVSSEKCFPKLEETGCLSDEFDECCQAELKCEKGKGKPHGSCSRKSWIEKSAMKQAKCFCDGNHQADMEDEAKWLNIDIGGHGNPTITSGVLAWRSNGAVAMALLVFLMN